MSPAAPPAAGIPQAVQKAEYELKAVPQPTQNVGWISTPAPAPKPSSATNIGCAAGAGVKATLALSIAG